MHSHLSTDVHMLPCSPITLFVSFSPRIPEGQAEAGSLAAGRLRSLEDQLTRAKQKIHSFQKLTGDGKHLKGCREGFGSELGNMKGLIFKVRG